MSDPDDDVLTAAELLALEPVGDDVFRSHRNQDNRAGIIFGGQPLAQALAAAAMTASPWPAHSLSGTFLRGGVVAEPVDYRVERVRDGRRYAARRVLAVQRDRPIFDALCSFHDPEGGESHQLGDVAGVPPPEALESLRDFSAAHADQLQPGMAAVFGRPFPAEIRLVNPEAALLGIEPAPARDYWLRMPSAAAETDPLRRQWLLAFLSDYWLAGTVSAGRVHGHARPGIASLTHALWFHGAADPADWLLFRSDSPWTGQGRGLARALAYDRAGRLVASVAQEISVRRR